MEISARATIDRSVKFVNDYDCGNVLSVGRTIDSEIGGSSDQRARDRGVADKYISSSGRANVRAEAADQATVNVLVHMNFRATCAGPLPCLSSDGLKVGSPGKSLVPSEGMTASTPRSRNRALTDLARLMILWQVTGSGLVKAIREVGAERFPQLNFIVDEGTTQVTLFAPRDFSETTGEERPSVLRQHGVLMGVRFRFPAHAHLTHRNLPQTPFIWALYTIVE